MKGIVFRELIEMMEEKFGAELTDEVLESLTLDSKAAYTSVGTYDHSEILQIVTILSQKTGIAGEGLVKAFGKYLMGSFYKIHPDYFKGKNIFDFLQSVDGYIHVEVKKLTPDAELPEIKFIHKNKLECEIVYKSKRPFADLAEGLIEGAIEVFNEKISVDVLDRSDAKSRKFILTKSA